MSTLRIVTFLALAVCFGTTYSQTINERAARDETTPMADEEPAMREAFNKAAATLDDFLAAAAKPRKGTSGYALKVAVSDGRNTEYFWVGRFTRKDDGFTGVLDNEPRLVKKYRKGQRFAFSREQIVDWTYMDTAQNRMMGNYTACALLSKEPPGEAEAFKKKYGLRCD